MSQWALRHVPSSRAPTSSALVQPKAHESVCSWAWASRAAWGIFGTATQSRMQPCAPHRLDRACSVVISIIFFSSPLPSRPVHARVANANGLLAARDCAGVHEKRLLMHELAHERARPRTIVTRTSAQRLIATEMDIRSRRSTRVQGLEKLRATCRSSLPGQGDG